MKNKAIPFFAALGCTLTACGEKETEETEDTNVDTEDTDTEDTDTEDTDTDTDEEENDVSAVVDIWTLEAMSYTYYGEVYETTFPDSYSYSYENYGTTWDSTRSSSIFLDIAESGEVAVIFSSSSASSFSIDGVEIYSYSYGYSSANSGGFIEQDGDSYLLDVDDEVFNCTLTEDLLHCESEERTADLRAGGEIPDDFENISENYPATPEYTKEDCIDAEITATGDALDWGGFDGVEDDMHVSCYYNDPYATYGYSYSENLEDLVFSFTAPNEGCFAFDSTGTNFQHGIKLVNSCDTGELACSLTEHIEYGLEEGQEVLVVIDGVSAEEQVFNLSINELSLDNSMHDGLPSDTSALDVSSWTEEVESNCGFISPAKTYLWTAPATGYLKFKLNNPTFEVIIKTEEAGCGGAATADCDIAGGGYYFAPANYAHQRQVTEGNEYLITIGSAYGDVGTLSMTLTLPE